MNAEQLLLYNKGNTIIDIPLPIESYIWLVLLFVSEKSVVKNLTLTKPKIFIQHYMYLNAKAVLPLEININP